MAIRSKTRQCVLFALMACAIIVYVRLDEGTDAEGAEGEARQHGPKRRKRDPAFARDHDRPNAGGIAALLAPVGDSTDVRRPPPRRRGKSGVQKLPLKAAGDAATVLGQHPQHPQHPRPLDTVEHTDAEYVSPWLQHIDGRSWDNGEGDESPASGRCFAAGCRYMDGPGQLRQCCCPERIARNNPELDPAALVCLPTFSVIGAQKSGSTALFGYFLSHPNFLPPNKKECHFFDKVRFVKPAGGGGGGGGGDGDGSNLDSKAFKNKAVKKYMSQMKTKEPHTVAETVTGDATPSYILSSSAPLFISNMLPHMKLVLVLRNPVDRVYSEWQMKARRVQVQLDKADTEAIAELVAVVDVCFLNRSIVGNDRYNPAHLLRNCQAMADLRTHPNGKLSWFVTHTKRMSRPILACYLEKIRDAGDIVLDKTSVFGGCTSLATLESVRPFDGIVRSEMQHIDQQCMAIAGGGAADGEAVFMWGKERCWPRGSDSNIVKDFVVRGLYLEQIKVFHEHFGEEQLLIIEHDDLKYRTDVTMKAVFDFVGLPELDSSVSMPSAGDLSKEIVDTWPSFESATGWHLESKYDKMSSKVRAELEAFYRPHNKRLAAYLGHPLGWGEDD